MEAIITKTVHFSDADYAVLAKQVADRFANDKAFEIAEIEIDDDNMFFSATVNCSRDFDLEKHIGCEEQIEWGVNSWGCYDAENKELETDLNPDRLYRIINEKYNI